MKPGSVVLDLSIDQGGCVETSRPTTLDQPTFRVHDVTHYCVPNMTSVVARTATHAFNNAAKRTVDIVGSIIGLVIAAPVVAVFAAFVYLESPALIAVPLPEGWSVWRDQQMGEVRMRLFRRQLVALPEEPGDDQTGE